jgi:hypothetical protein
MARDGEMVRFGELEEQANCGAHTMRKLRPANGDTLSFVCDNRRNSSKNSGPRKGLESILPHVEMADPWAPLGQMCLIEGD